MECDVIVVGAGPAGLAASITAAEKGMKTVLLEKSTEIGYPVKTSALTWAEVMNSWNIPKVVMSQWYTSFFISSSYSQREVEINFKRKVCGVLNYHAFLQELAFRAAQKGVYIFLAERAIEPLIKNEKVIGVKTDKKSINSKVVIDASGPSAIIGKKAGIIPEYKNLELGVGIEYEMTNVLLRNQHSFDFYVGKETVPIGYAWVFPVGKDRARVGIDTVYNTPENIEEENIRYWHNKFLSESSPIYSYVKKAQPYETHGGAYPLCGIVEKPYTDGLILAGDSAAQASMLVGEGIRYALEFGKYAAEIASKAIRLNDYTENTLRDYCEKCSNYLGETFLVAADLLKVPTDEYWEAVLDSIIRAKKEKQEELCLKYLKTAFSYDDARNFFPQFINKYLPSH